MKVGTGKFFVNMSAGFSVLGMKDTDTALSLMHLHM